MKAFAVGFILGQWILQFLVFMFKHPVRFLIGVVRIALVIAALILGIAFPIMYNGAGWAWIVFPILLALVLLFGQIKLRDLAESFQPA